MQDKILDRSVEKSKPFPKLTPKSETLLSLEEQSKIPNSLIQKLLFAKKVLTLHFNAMIESHLAYFRLIKQQKKAIQAKKLKANKKPFFNSKNYIDHYESWKRILRKLKESLGDQAKSFVSLFSGLHHALMGMFERIIVAVLAPIIKSINILREKYRNYKIVVENYLSDALKKSYKYLYQGPHPELELKTNLEHPYQLDINLNRALKQAIQSYQIYQLLGQSELYNRINPQLKAGPLDPTAASRLSVNPSFELEDTEEIKAEPVRRPHPHLRPSFSPYAIPRPRIY